MNNKQLAYWLRIVEIKAAVLSIAFFLDQDSMYSLEEAKKGLIEIADSLETVEEMHLEEVRGSGIEELLLLEKKSTQAVSSSMSA